MKMLLTEAEWVALWDDSMGVPATVTLDDEVATDCIVAQRVYFWTEDKPHHYWVEVQYAHKTAPAFYAVYTPVFKAGSFDLIEAMNMLRHIRSYDKLVSAENLTFFDRLSSLLRTTYSHLEGTDFWCDLNCFGSPQWFRKYLHMETIGERLEAEYFYEPVTFEEVLNSVPDKIKEELLFHLDVFT